jgi:peptidoglycan/xylan/chitin deacetylase (PgdA/CDA1 family)
MHFFHVPIWIQQYFSGLTWAKYSSSDKVIYLTFDDGPIPEVTPRVLEILKSKNAKATFFCVGENIKKNPNVFKQLVDEGHTYGNHTFNHLKGWNHSAKEYLNNIHLQELEIQKQGFNKSKFFRPPYGRIKPSQAKILKQSFEIVMWDVLTCDYDKNLSVEKCLNQAIKNTKPGSIVLFHDSLKSQERVLNVLPKYLDHFAGLGYRFESL